MARRNQPYLPLYVQDFLTDEKLIECSAQSTGVYIRLMCIMHKADEYGVILLKQKDKQNEQQINNFACKLAKQLPYSFDIIITSLCELLEENVLQIDGDRLVQKRMVRDNQISSVRASNGSKGGKKAKENDSFATDFASDFATAKVQANTDIESDIDIDTDNVPKDSSKTKSTSSKKKPKFIPPTLAEVVAYCQQRKSRVDPKKFYDFFTADAENPWVDSAGNPVRNWKQKIVTWEGREKNKQKEEHILG